MFNTEFPDFVNHRLLPGGHCQTVVASFSRSAREPADTVRHVIPTTCDDQLALHENRPNHSVPQRQVLLLHGLAGCHQSSYVLRTTGKLLDAGFRVWRLDSRGSGAGLRLARFHHHAGRTEDLQSAVDQIFATDPDTPLTVVGFSLGANLVLNWLGSDTPIGRGSVDSAIAVSPPINLFSCTANLKQGLSRVYDYYFARVMLRQLSERRRSVSGLIDRTFERAPASLSQFDAEFTAPAGGFSSLDDYYEKCSSWYKLARIDVPTLMIADRQDPVIPFSMYDQKLFSDAIQFRESSGGGHIGYVARRGIDPDPFWLDWRIVQSIQSLDSNP